MYNNESNSSLHVIIYEEPEDDVLNELENGYNNSDVNFIVSMNSPKLDKNQFQALAISSNSE